MIAKLIAFNDTGSDKHFRDARGILLLQWETIDLDALARAARGADVLAEFERLLAVVRQDLP